MAQNSLPLISIIIVNYKVGHEICQLIRSMQEAILYEETETIVVDNASDDNSRQLVMKHDKDVIWLQLKTNIGFGKACNVAFKSSRGKYLLFINPDTLISKNTLKESLTFLESHQDIGIMGPKIIYPDGTFQFHSRRSFPTPFNSFAYMLGLNKIFPKSKLFGSYAMTHIGPDTSMEVDAVSGSFIFIRSSLFKELNGFDEAFFMYGEDLDICARCKKQGYKVWYNPATQIIHYKGKSSTKNILRSRIAFYEAMVIFSRKYRHTYGTFFPGWLLRTGIILQACLNISKIFFKTATACLIDLFLINLVIFILTFLRFHNMILYSKDGNINFTTLGMHLLLSVIFISCYAYKGIYSSERYSIRNTFIASFMAILMFLTVLFFIKSMAYSRIVYGTAAIVISIILVAWREILPRIVSDMKQSIYSTGRVIILGNSNITGKLIKEIEKDNTAEITGIIWPVEANEKGEGQFHGYPVLGNIKNLNSILERTKIDLLIIATKESWYSSIIEALTFLHLKNVTIKWVSHELFEMSEEQLPSPIPLHDFSV